MVAPRGKNEKGYTSLFTASVPKGLLKTRGFWPTNYLALQQFPPSVWRFRPAPPANAE